MLLKLLGNDQESRFVLLMLLAVTLIIPLCNLIFSAGSAFYFSAYTVSLIGKYLTFALLALSLDLVWGYCGILVLGQGAFFALGGYAMGMYLMRQIGDRGVYGNPDLPDFMVFLDWKELPWYWSGFESFPFALLMVMVAPAILAFVFGWLTFRSRVTGVYFSIISQALTYALLLSFFRNEMGFGGNNGLTDFKDIIGFSLQSDTVRALLLMGSGMILIAAFMVCQWMIKTRLGRVVTAIRDHESRVRFLGYRVEMFKLWIFVFSAILAGLAGALYVPQVGIINPSEFSPLISLEIVVWVAVGGRGSLYGAIIGAVLVNYSKTVLTGLFPEVWLFTLGAVFILVTIYMPDGLVGLWKRKIGGFKDE
ncbi:MAG: urea ABC transporter permease subunit UrtC [Methylococcaceae bacterium]|nr:urea ABC transporter permease subunit UrtC [Methylococcaceae bacterium]